jgi:hypothetical protein
VRELLAAVDADVHAGPLHPPPRFRIAVEGERDAGSERERVRPGREFVLRNLDELDLELAKELDQPHGHERRVADGEIDVERRDHRQQVQQLVPSAVVRQIERQHVDIRERAGQRGDARVVRPVAAADDQRLGVEPERVAALGTVRRRVHGRAP